jgi:hypothetical protein
MTNKNNNNNNKVKSKPLELFELAGKKFFRAIVDLSKKLVPQSANQMKAYLLTTRARDPSWTPDWLNFS